MDFVIGDRVLVARSSCNGLLGPASFDWYYGIVVNYHVYWKYIVKLENASKIASPYIYCTKAYEIKKIL